MTYITHHTCAPVIKAGHHHHQLYYCVKYSGTYCTNWELFSSCACIVLVNWDNASMSTSTSTSTSTREVEKNVSSSTLTVTQDGDGNWGETLLLHVSLTSCLSHLCELTSLCLCLHWCLCLCCMPLYNMLYNDVQYTCTLYLLFIVQGRCLFKDQIGLVELFSGFFVINEFFISSDTKSTKTNLSFVWYQ